MHHPGLTKKQEAAVANRTDLGVLGVTIYAL
jgi:hypothetical protein